jgi:hypothetical protein
VERVSAREKKWELEHERAQNKTSDTYFRPCAPLQ